MRSPPGTATLFWQEFVGSLVGVLFSQTTLHVLFATEASITDPAAAGKKKKIIFVSVSLCFQNIMSHHA